MFVWESVMAARPNLMALPTEDKFTTVFLFTKTIFKMYVPASANVIGDVETHAPVNG